MSEKLKMLGYSCIRSPLAPLALSERLRQEKGGNKLKVPLFKGDLGGSTRVQRHIENFSDIL
jgi:hypothetical protein